MVTFFLLWCGLWLSSCVEGVDARWFGLWVRKWSYAVRI